MGNATPETEVSEQDQGHQKAPASEDIFSTGRNFIEKSDCIACHAVDKVVVGPSYLDIAERYKADANAKDLLVNNIIQGSRGNWGDRPMAAHPQLSEEEVSEMVNYILSLADEKN